jgi:LCP family protein required for cell wall assembly
VQAFKPSRYAGGRAKMTESFFFGAQNGAGVAGGTELLALTIGSTLGITFNAAAIINFESFEAVLNALGGVYMCVDEDVTSKHLVMGPNGQPVNIENDDHPELKGTPITYKKGTCMDMAPWQALDYSRQRYGLAEGDYDRQRHQQQLIKAIVKKAASAGVLTNPGKLNSVISAAGAAFVLDTNGVPMGDFLFALKGINPTSLPTLKTNAGKVNTTLINNIAYETLTPASVDMFAAVKNDTLAAFVSAHPDYVGT